MTTVTAALFLCAGPVMTRVLFEDLAAAEDGELLASDLAAVLREWANSLEAEDDSGVDTS